MEIIDIVEKDFVQEHPEFPALQEQYGCGDWSDFNERLPEHEPPYTAEELEIAYTDYIADLKEFAIEDIKSAAQPWGEVAVEDFSQFSKWTSGPDFEPDSSVKVLRAFEVSDGWQYLVKVEDTEGVEYALLGDEYLQEWSTYHDCFADIYNHVNDIALGDSMLLTLEELGADIHYGDVLPAREQRRHELH